jgi:uncharacterized membrane protein YccC
MAKSKTDTKQARPADDQPRLSAHPKARRQIRAFKAWSGLVAFVLVQYLSLKAGLPMFEAGMRGIAAGLVGYVLGWVAAVMVWRQLAVAELEALRRHLTTPPADDQGVAAT